ncbi:PTS lactose/cellobiose transporter subunit IIA [Enterococcus sp. DIV0876]|uniref:PTS lactose/cellobiose transporter subunit IIA n=1 Tax=Enterococcus sp. DIV0876 TaxID=2774633 RepID=UPI003D30038B
MENEMKIMQLIAQGGDARSYAMKGIALARKSKIAEAKEAIKTGRASVTKAHHIQTELIQKEASGEKQEITLLMIHAQDHLMNAMTVLDLAEEFIYVYEREEDEK